MEKCVQTKMCAQKQAPKRSICEKFGMTWPKSANRTKTQAAIKGGNAENGELFLVVKKYFL